MESYVPYIQVAHHHIFLYAIQYNFYDKTHVVTFTIISEEIYDFYFEKV